MRYDLAQHSLTGARPSNQDRIAVAERDNAVLLVLADGLGGHEGGELAAETLAQTAVRLFQAVRQPVITQPSAFLALTIMKSHKNIVERGRTHNPPIAPRTTCVLCLVQNGYAYWAHVGDSRLYHYRGDELLARTQDHTFTEELRQEGLLSEEEMPAHPDKSRLLKCLGGPTTPSISFGEETALQLGDTLLLCSDGLWEAFTQGDILRYVQFQALDEGVEEMLFAAESKMKQACDNLSAVCLRWREARTALPPLQADADSTSTWPGSKLPGEAPTPQAESPTPDATLREIENLIRELGHKH